MPRIAVSLLAALLLTCATVGLRNLTTGLGWSGPPAMYGSAVGLRPPLQ